MSLSRSELFDLSLAEKPPLLEDLRNSIASDPDHIPWWTGTSRISIGAYSKAMTESQGERTRDVSRSTPRSHSR
jgi:hypothetical protein